MGFKKGVWQKRLDVSIWLYDSLVQSYPVGPPLTKRNLRSNIDLCFYIFHSHIQCHAQWQTRIFRYNVQSKQMGGYFHKASIVENQYIVSCVLVQSLTRWKVLNNVWIQPWPSIRQHCIRVCVCNYWMQIVAFI